MPTSRPSGCTPRSASRLTTATPTSTAEAGASPRLGVGAAHVVPGDVVGAELRGPHRDPGPLEHPGHGDVEARRGGLRHAAGLVVDDGPRLLDVAPGPLGRLHVPRLGAVEGHGDRAARDLRLDVY